MKTYRVEGGVAQFGPGAVLGLTEAQAMARHMRRDRMGKTDDGRHVCRTKQPVEFKVGEILMLPAAPDKGLAERLVPVGHDDSIPRPQLAAAKADAAKKEAAEAKAKKASRRR